MWLAPGLVHTARPQLTSMQWADSETNPQYAWNEQDGNINRISYMGEYKLDGNGLPINPVGRTGMAGRGVLGKWGKSLFITSVFD